MADGAVVACDVGVLEQRGARARAPSRKPSSTVAAALPLERVLQDRKRGDADAATDEQRTTSAVFRHRKAATERPEHP